MYTFSDALLAAIMNGTVVLPKDDAIFGPSEAVDNSISFNLKYGGYLIALSNGTSRIYQPIATFVKPEWDKTTNKYELKAENVNGSATGKAEAKSMKITSTKTMKVNSGGTVNNNGRAAHGQIGDSFIFQVETPIPNYPVEAANKSFTVQDHPTPGLTVTTGSITVKIDGKELTKEKDYTTDTIAAQSGNNRGTGFKVEFDEKQYKENLANAGKEAKKLVIEYKGTLDNEAPIQGGTKNSAHPLIPKDLYKPGAEYATPTPAVTQIYTYGVKITKIGKAGKGGEASKPPKLQGAKFELYRGVENGEKVYVKQQTTGTGAGAAAGKYIVNSSGSGGGMATFTSGKDGLLQIDGLDAGTYILKEIKAPDGGYALRARPIAIVIKDNDFDGRPDTATTAGSNVGKNISKIGGKPAEVDTDNRLTYSLVNKKANFKLPKTGAIGAVIFGVVGAALIATSAVLVVVHRRRKTKRSS